jgi:hypothetical protein
VLVIGVNDKPRRIERAGASPSSVAGGTQTLDGRGTRNFFRACD